MGADLTRMRSRAGDLESARLLFPALASTIAPGILFYSRDLLRSAELPGGERLRDALQIGGLLDAQRLGELLHRMQDVAITGIEIRRIAKDKHGTSWCVSKLA